MSEFSQSETQEPRPAVSRRGFLVSAGLATGVAAVGVGTGYAVAQAEAAQKAASGDLGQQKVH